MYFARKTFAVLLVVTLLTGYPAAQHSQRPDVISKRDTLKHLDLPKLYARLSEPGGYFGSDNLISNELSYQHVLHKLEKMNVTGGAYLGVGPDQNFTYIARIKPHIAFMIDIRRDNMLQHLLFKAIFIMAHNRAAYMALLFGRPVPTNIKQWNERSINDLVDYVDRTPMDPKLAARNWTEIRERVKGFGYALSDRDLETIGEIYRAFYESGLEVRYQIRDRPSNRFFPPYRDLLLETDLQGHKHNYFATEADFQVIKQMQERNLIVPVTGDLSGTQAVRAIGQYLNETGEHVSAFYTSNVEFYLWRQDGFGRFVENLKALPIDQRSVIIRSYFNYAYYAYQHPQTVENYFSVQILQTIESLLKDQSAGGYQDYFDLVTRQCLDLK